MSEVLLKLVGSKVREHRKERGMSQEELGEKAGFHFSYIGGLERGNKNISLNNLARIADALNIEVAELFAFNETLHNKLKSTKDSDLAEILFLLLNKDDEDVRRAKNILYELFSK